MMNCVAGFLVAFWSGEIDLSAEMQKLRALLLLSHN
jgi:hypothetical protein